MKATKGITYNSYNINYNELIWKYKRIQASVKLRLEREKCNLNPDGFGLNDLNC